MPEATKYARRFWYILRIMVCQKKTGHQIGLDWSQGGLAKVESLTSSESGSTRSQLVREERQGKTAGARRNLTGSTQLLANADHNPNLVHIRNEC